MRDNDFATLGERLQDAAKPPDFEVLERRGQRLRRQRAGAAAVTVAVATAGVVVATSVGAGGPRDNTQPPVVSRSTASATATPPDNRRPGPEEIVTDRDAELVALAVSPEDPDVRAAIWQACGRYCFGPPYGVTVTADGFTTSTYVPVPELGSFAYVQSVGDETFFLGGNRRETGQLVEADGTVTKVQSDEAPRPLADGEVLVGSEYNQYLALDARTAVSHPIDTLASTLLQAPDGRLWGTATVRERGRPRAAVVWSVDGGASWSRHLLPRIPNAMFEPIPSAADDTMAVVTGGAGATFFPLNAVFRSTDGGATWETIDESSYGMTQDWMVVRPDGSLLVNAPTRSGDHAGQPSDEPHGLHVSNGSDWTELLPLDPSVPGVENPNQGYFGWTPSLLTTAVDAAGRHTLYVSDAEERVFASTDGGRTWSRVAAR